MNIIGTISSQFLKHLKKYILAKNKTENVLPLEFLGLNMETGQEYAYNPNSNQERKLWAAEMPILQEGTCSWTVSWSCSVNISCCCTTSTSFQQVINKNTPHRQDISTSYHINIARCSYTILCSQVKWDYHLSLSTKTDTEQLFIPYLSLSLLIVV